MNNICPIIVNLAVIAIGALVLFAICDRCMTFVVYIAGFILIVLLCNIYFFNQDGHEDCALLSAGESLLTRLDRDAILNVARGN